MLNDIEHDFNSDKDYFKSRRAYYKKYKDEIQALAAELELPKDTPITAYGETDQIRLSVSGTPETLKEVFRAFRKLGYQPSKRPGIKPESTFTTRFEQDNHPNFYLSFCSTICKRVKVGTKMVEQAIYETTCE